MLPSGNPNNFFRWTKSAIVSAAGNLVRLHLIPSPAARTGWRSTRTIQSPFLAGSSRNRNQVGAIPVGAEADKIAHRALRTFHAMSNPPRHNMRRLVRRYPSFRARAGRKRTLLYLRRTFSDLCPGPHTGPKTSRVSQAVDYHQSVRWETGHACWTGECVRGQDCRAIRVLTESSTSVCWGARYIAARSVPRQLRRRRTAAISRRLQPRPKPVSGRACGVVRRAVRELPLEWAPPTRFRAPCV